MGASATLRLGCALLVCGGIWETYRDSHLQEVKAESAQSQESGDNGRPSRPSWLDQAAAVARTFPVDPELWQQAARLLMGGDPATARNLLAMAGTVRPDSTAIQQDLAAAAASSPEATRAWGARAFALDGGSYDRSLRCNPCLAPAGRRNADGGRGRAGAILRSAALQRAAAYVGWPA